MTTTFFLTSAGFSSASRPAQGFMAQVMGRPCSMFGTQPSRQAMQGVSFSSWPFLALFGSSGSAMLWRPKAMRSARPCFTSSSAYCGSVKRPTRMTGTDTALFISAPSSALKPPWVMFGAHMNSSWMWMERVTWMASTPQTCSR